MPEDQKTNKVFIKHNKKRNAGLLFEFLTRFVAETTMFGSENDDSDLYLEMMIRYFDPNTELGKELGIVRSLADKRYSSKELAARSIYEFKNNIRNINHEQSNIEKSNLIKEINYSIGMDLYSIDVPNYRLHTSIYGLYEAIKNKNYSAEAQYEEMLLQNLTESSASNENENLNESEYSDAVVALMVNKLNERLDKYKIKESQRAVLQNYISLQQGELSEEEYKGYLDFKFNEVYNALLQMDSDPKFQEPQIQERITSLKEIFKSSSVFESPDDMTSIVVEGLSFLD